MQELVHVCNVFYLLRKLFVKEIKSKKKVLFMK